MVKDAEDGAKGSETVLELQIRELLISELGTKSFDQLLELIPSDKVISEIGKLAIYSGTAIATNARNRLGFEGNGPEEVMLPMYWIHACISHENYSPPEVHERGVVFEHYSCPLSRARPEICISISHFGAEAVCRSVNPDFEYIFTHHLANGDGRCRYIVRRKGGKGDFEDLGRLVKVMPRLELTEDEKLYLGDQTMMYVIIYILSVARDMGVEEEMLAGLELELRAIGRRLALFLENELTGELEGKEGMLRAIGICQRSMVMQGELNAQIEPEGLKGEVTVCPFQDSPNLACREFELVMNGVCEVICPDFEFAYDRMMTKGDKNCTWSLTRKKAVKPSEKEQAQDSTDDPAKVLSLRLARGEISEEEYERKMQLILKHYLKA
ncbi:MAG: SHOCT domain-containing protein [Methanomassiliicoccales archaeon]|nr:SHOCT domain-containing protein [Methanomassiliicoccales archaeon]